MHPDRFDTLTAVLPRPRSRRGALRGLGSGLFAAASLALAVPDGETKKKKKKCKKPPTCPDSCGFVFYEPGPGGGKICGIGQTLQRNGQLCIPCSQSSPCTSASFPHCLNSVEDLNTGAISYFTNSCGAYTDGVCGNVSACVT
jgi:hypothetical protein